MAASGVAGKKWIWASAADGVQSGEEQVRRALVHASSVLSTRDRRYDPREVHSIDMRPLVLHLLEGLQLAGFKTVVVTLGENRRAIVDAIQSANLSMLVTYVHVPPSVWRTLANSIIHARAAFPSEEPFMIVRADQCYNWRLLKKVAQAMPSPGIEAIALIDTDPSTLDWAAGAHCTAACRANGRCNALVKVLRDRSTQRIMRMSHTLVEYDAVNAGDVYIARPSVFAVLMSLVRESPNCATADAMSELASRGAMGYVEVGSERLMWFGSRTITAVFRTPDAGFEQGRSGKGWSHVVQAARQLMLHASDAPEGRHEGRRAWPANRVLLPLLHMGDVIGQGANCKVIAAEVYHTGHSADRSSEKMKEVMWEVHVLRQVQHPHIVRLCDTIEFTDAVYVVMERYNGPCLLDHIAAQPDGRLPETSACRLFSHMLAALRHALDRGFIHCDMKPANVRLNAACNHAIVIDWAMARSLRRHGQEDIARGTPMYAPPEQLTGHNPEGAWGGDQSSRTLGPPADVWSLGATLHEMVSGAPPFGGGSFDELRANVMALNFASSGAPLAAVDTSADVRRIVAATLQVLPSERATLAELCVDEWVTRAGHLPPALPIPWSTSGDGFLERADVDGLVGGKQVRSPGLRALSGAIARKLSALVGFTPSQMGMTPLAQQMGIQPPAASPFVQMLLANRRALLGVVYAVLTLLALRSCELPSGDDGAWGLDGEAART